MANRRNQGQPAQRLANAIQGELKDMGVEAQERIGELGDVARDQLRGWEENLVEQIREKPFQSVLIAAGVGLLVGMFYRR